MLPQIHTTGPLIFFGLRILELDQTASFLGFLRGNVSVLVDFALGGHVSGGFREVFLTETPLFILKSHLGLAKRLLTYTDSFLKAWFDLSLPG